MEDTKARIAAAIQRHESALHAVQTGVKQTLALDSRAAGYSGSVLPDTSSGSPKHLRTGVNSALINAGALAHLLVDKGVFTEAEYHEMLAVYAEKEKERYETELTARMGAKISLI